MRDWRNRETDSVLRMWFGNLRAGIGGNAELGEAAAAVRVLLAWWGEHRALVGWRALSPEPFLQIFWPGRISQCFWSPGIIYIVVSSALPRSWIRSWTKEPMVPLLCNRKVDIGRVR